MGRMVKNKNKKNVKQKREENQEKKMAKNKKTQKRKIDHIELCKEEEVEFNNKTTLLEKIKLPKTIPNINLEDINTKTSFLGKETSAPIFITALTGGEERSEKINKDIAQAAGELRLGMQLGSQRSMLENESLTYTYNVKRKVEEEPSFLIGNIGIVQLKEYSIKELNKMIESIEGDGLAVHVNPAQEAAQPEGDTNFKGVMPRLKEVSRKLEHPVIVKQVGEGISRRTAKKLEKMNLYGIDIGGSGGSNWTKIENLRSNEKDKETFLNWGIPTAKSLIQTKEEYKSGKITATGGIRNGLDVAKSIALGAEACGVGLPILRAQQKEGKKGVKETLEKMIKELKIAMFLTNCKTIEELKSLEPEITEELN